MKKSTKFVSLLLSVMLAVSTFAGVAVLPVNAADGEQRIYFRFPDDSVWRHEGLKITARTGKANVYCYAYNIYGHKGNNGKYKTGWKTRTTQCDAEAEGGAITDATLFSFNLASVQGGIEEGADYGVIFSTAAIDQNQTCDLTMSTDCIGSTMYVTPYTEPRTGETYATRENAADSHKVDYYAAWMYPDGTKREDYGPKATISSLGVLMPGLFPNNQPRAAMLSNELKNYLTNPVNNPYFQYDNNMVLCNELGTTPQAVYEQYLADNAKTIEEGEASEYPDGETDPKVPVPFYRYMDENDQGQIVEKKLAVPAAVREVLGISDEDPTTEEPTTEEPTTLPTAVESVTLTSNATINVGEAIPGSQKFSYEDEGYGISNCGFEEYSEGATFAYGTDYHFGFTVEPEAGYVLTDDTVVTLNVNDQSVEPTDRQITHNDDGTMRVTCVFSMPEEPTTEEPTTEPAPADTYTVAGSSAAIFGTTWDATNTANDMTLGEGGVYSIVYTDVQPENAIQLKVLKNHSWDEAWGDKETGDNYTFNVVEACDVTVTFDPATETVNRNSGHRA